MIANEAQRTFGKDNLVAKLVGFDKVLAGSYGGMTAPFLIERLRDGLEMEELESLREMLGIPMDRLAQVLGIAKATLHRRKSEGKLKPDESDRVVRFARLVGRAVEVFKTLDYARMWILHPQPGLGGEIPLEFASTEVGAREVELLIGRIEHGVVA